MWVKDYQEMDPRDVLAAYATCGGHNTEPMCYRREEINYVISRVEDGERWVCDHDREAAAAALRELGVDPKQHPDAVEHLAHDPDLLEAVRDGEVKIDRISCDEDLYGELYDALIDALARRQEEEWRWEQEWEIRRWAEPRGYYVWSTIAETGTRYLVIDNWLKVRIGDHAPLYSCHVDISPVGHADAASAIVEIEQLLNRYHA